MEINFEIFPDPRTLDPTEDFYAVGADLRPEFLIEAYQKGIFPWPNSEMSQILWASPAQRGILHFANLHLSKSLKRHLKKIHFSVSFDHAFEDVISMCRAVVRPGQTGTWITAEMERAYVNFHQLGFAHSVEVWLDHRLVGGLYGVSLNGLFFAESMFHIEDHASKFALIELCRHLQSKGLTWIDVQVLNPVTESLGGRAMSRLDFLDLLSHSANPDLLLWPKKK